MPSWNMLSHARIGKGMLSVICPFFLFLYRELRDLEDFAAAFSRCPNIINGILQAHFHRFMSFDLKAEIQVFSQLNGCG